MNKSNIPADETKKVLFVLMVDEGAHSAFMGDLTGAEIDRIENILSELFEKQDGD